MQKLDCGLRIAKFAAMRNPSRVLLALVVLMVFGIARPSQASLIDFTDASAWSGVAGLSNYTSATLFDGVSVTVSSAGGNLTFNSGGDVNALCAGTTGLACDGDGLGVGDDEVTYGRVESLVVSFSKPVSVTTIGFLDLFGYPNKSGDPAAETAKWKVYHSVALPEFGSLTGTDTSTTLGAKHVDTSYSDVTKIKFYTSSPAASNSDFAVAGIRISAVPEPATLLLTGIGFVASSSIRRRIRSRA